MGMILDVIGASLLTLATLLTPAASSAKGQDEPRQRNDRKLQENLTREVRHQLLLLPYYSVFDNLMFKVDVDRVTLLGQVVRPNAETRRGKRSEEYRRRSVGR